LQTATHLNATIGKIVNFLPDRKRYQVQFYQGGSVSACVSLAPDNIFLLQEKVKAIHGKVVKRKVIFLNSIYKMNKPNLFGFVCFVILVILFHRV